MRSCWCGNSQLLPFGPEYGKCEVCGTLVYLKDVTPDQLLVNDDESDFYGKQYWLNHQQDSFGYDNIHARARNDLSERNLFWLRTLLSYCLPPATVLELGCAHGSFVALLSQAGYDAAGVELSPWVVEFGRNTFDVPIHVGPVETLDVPEASLDCIALMDVLEHLPAPASTMRHCLSLLKPGGFLLIQTPEFQEEFNYQGLVDSNAPFLEQLKSDEHLYLFSRRSVLDFFKRLGVEHVIFQPAIFAHYDMFFLVSKSPLQLRDAGQIDEALLRRPKSRLVQALLDISAREQESHGQASVVAQLNADVEHLKSQLDFSESDRAARLAVIEAQGSQVGRIPALEGQVEQLIKQLSVVEDDRAARLDVIHQQGAEIDQLKAEKAELAEQLRVLQSRWWSRVGKKIRTL